MDEMQIELANKVEAVLFATGRDMEAEEIAKIIGIGSIGVIKEAIKSLVDEYNKRSTSLQIYEENGKYKLNIKKSYNYLTTKLITDCELDFPAQETLAIIAYKQPILQTEIIKSRGSSAYDHIHLLKEKGLVTSEKSGRTRELRLTPKFYDYFDVVEDQLRAKFQEVGEKIEIPEEKQATIPETEEISKEDSGNEPEGAVALSSDGADDEKGA